MTDKDAYVQKLHAKLDEWNAEIDKLKAKADKAEADSRTEPAAVRPANISGGFKISPIQT